MAPDGIRLHFFKLNVPAMEPALEFWRAAFGFSIVQSFDEPDFVEHILALPGQEAGPNLLLVAWKHGRNVTPGPGHGPVGFAVDDIETMHEQAISAGAQRVTGVLAVGPVQVAMLKSPEGHEIELVQLPA